MAHAHHHHDGESASEYYVEQLFTILVCGSLGLVGVMLYQTGKLEFILAKQFHLPVLVGGLAVMGLVLVRAIAVWKEAGEGHPHIHSLAHHPHDQHGHDHVHDHVHGPDCDHDHAHDHAHHHHDHAHHGHHHHHGEDDHGHSHDLAWVFLKLVILVFPVALFLMGVPNSGFSQDRILKMVGQGESVGSAALQDVAAKAGTVMSFNDLNDAAYDEGKRESMQGQTAVLKGRFKRLGDKEFTLFRLKMTCCSADTIPLKVSIITPQAVGGYKDLDWVQVKGQIQFVKSANSSRYTPVIKVADLTDITPTTPESEYEG